MHRDFNSIKVRLKPQGEQGVPGVGIEFQFHKGTIKTCAENLVRELYDNFNSIKVRLKLVRSAYYNLRSV